MIVIIGIKRGLPPVFVPQVCGLRRSSRARKKGTFYFKKGDILLSCMGSLRQRSFCAGRLTSLSAAHCFRYTTVLPKRSVAKASVTP